MNTKTTLLLLAITGALLGFIYFWETKQPSTQEAAIRDQYVLLFDRNEIDGIAITSNEEKIKLTRRGTRWEMDAPVKDQANQSAVKEILGRCEALSKIEKLETKGMEKKQLKDFGVGKQANLRLRLTGKGEPLELAFGKETAVEGRMYVRLEGSSQVAIVSSELKALLTRKADELRERRVTEADPSRVTKLAFKTVAGEIALLKEQGHWALSKPLKGRADDATVNRLLRDIAAMEIAGFEPEKGGNLDSYGLSEPRGTVTLQTGSGEPPLLLQLGAQDAKTGQVFARLSHRGAVCLLPSAVERLITLKPGELRDRHLIRVDFDTVDRITIMPEGKPPILLQRRLEEWVRLDPATQATLPANTAKVQALVQRLQASENTGFAADVTANLSEFGLDQPKMRVRFSSYASENTAETSAGEQPLLTLAFGAVKEGQVYARVEEEPFVVTVDPALVEAISPEAADWEAKQ